MERMLKVFLVAAAGVAAGVAATAPAARAQDSDYFLLALTWTPSFCLAEGTARDSEQCDPARDLGFTLHGLWPQYEDGWPEFCDSDARDPSRRETAAMADIMGSGGLAWHQWKKHGRCAGMTPEDYFAAARRAYESVAVPDFDGSRVSADGVEAAFAAANPALEGGEMVVTCRGDLVREVRICLDLALAPRECGADVARSACAYGGNLDLPPVP
jgi:ribonuclease T2